tara:strand:+ start:428 stop:628 length:201 start_codon:yes stop_codon:yes gene_type:complete
MSVEEILNGLDFLAYEADKHGRINKERLLYSAAKALRAGQALRIHRDGSKEHDEACAAWDDATRRG